MSEVFNSEEPEGNIRIHLEEAVVQGFSEQPLTLKKGDKIVWHYPLRFSNAVAQEDHRGRFEHSGIVLDIYKDGAGKTKILFEWDHVRQDDGSPFQRLISTEEDLQSFEKI